MKGNCVRCIVLVIAALHVAVLSMMCGLRHGGYIVAAALSATVIWGVVFFLNRRKRRVGCMVGVVAGLVAQQAAYQVWKTDLSGFWWPLAQFGALQFLIAYSVERLVA